MPLSVCESRSFVALVACVGMVLFSAPATLFGHHQIIRELEACRQTAEAEWQHHRAGTELAHWRVQRFAELEQLGHSSWQERAAATSDLARAVATEQSAERLFAWLTRQADRAAVVLPNDIEIPVEEWTRLELSLPGSMAVLGWVRPERLPEDRRVPILQLMLRRDALRLELDQRLSAARRNVAAVERQELRLLSQPDARLAERERVRLELLLARSELAASEAAQRQSRFEFEGLKAASIVRFSAASSTAGTEQAIEPNRIDGARQNDAHVAHLKMLVRVLSLEAAAQGEVEMILAAKQMATWRAGASESLHRDGHLSVRDAGLAQADLGRTAFTAQQVLAKKDWQSRWESRWSRLTPTSFHESESESESVPNSKPVASQSAHQRSSTGREGVAGGDLAEWSPSLLEMPDLSDDVLRDRALVHKSMSLIRQWLTNVAERETLADEARLRAEFVERLSGLQGANAREIESARHAEAFVAARRVQAGDRAAVVRLLYEQTIQAARLDSGRACELSAIDDDEAGLLQSVADEQALRRDDHRSEARFAEARRRVAGLTELRTLGHASVAELEQAQEALARAEEQVRAAQLTRQVADIERQLTTELLRLRSTVD